MEPTGLQRLYSPLCIHQECVGSSKSQALVSLDFVVVVIDKYWVIHKPLVRAFGSISQRQLVAGRLSLVLEAKTNFLGRELHILCSFSSGDIPIRS